MSLSDTVRKYTNFYTGFPGVDIKKVFGYDFLEGEIQGTTIFGKGDPPGYLYEFSNGQKVGVSFNDSFNHPFVVLSPPKVEPVKEISFTEALREWKDSQYPNPACFVGSDFEHPCGFCTRFAETYPQFFRWVTPKNKDRNGYYRILNEYGDELKNS